MEREVESTVQVGDLSSVSLSTDTPLPAECFQFFSASILAQELARLKLYWKYYTPTLSQDSKRQT